MSCGHPGRIPRRRLLAQGVLLAGAATSLHAPAAATGAGGSREHAERAFAMLERALGLGDRPYGAVVVRAGEVVGFGPSRVIVDGDPTAHAEVVAIRDACRRLATRDLGDCTLYSTSPPCPMCETAAYWARIERVFHGRDATDGGQPRYPAC